MLECLKKDFSEDVFHWINKYNNDHTQRVLHFQRNYWFWLCCPRCREILETSTIPENRFNHLTAQASNADPGLQQDREPW